MLSSTLKQKIKNDVKRKRVEIGACRLLQNNYLILLSQRAVITSVDLFYEHLSRRNAICNYRVVHGGGGGRWPLLLSLRAVRRGVKVIVSGAASQIL
jgi:hypothetical protein